MRGPVDRLPCPCTALHKYTCPRDKFLWPCLYVGIPLRSSITGQSVPKAIAPSASALCHLLGLACPDHMYAHEKLRMHKHVDPRAHSVACPSNAYPYIPSGRIATLVCIYIQDGPSCRMYMHRLTETHTSSRRHDWMQDRKATAINQHENFGLTGSFFRSSLVPDGSMQHKAGE